MQKVEDKIMLNKKQELPEEEFTVLITPPRKTAIDAVSINADGFVQPNASFAAKIAKLPLKFAFSADGRHFLLKQVDSDDPSQITFAKGGRRKLPDTNDLLRKKQLTYPVRYEVFERKDGGWQGDYAENPTMSFSAKPRKSKGK